MIDTKDVSRGKYMKVIYLLYIEKVSLEVDKDKYQQQQDNKDNRFSWKVPLGKE